MDNMVAQSKTKRNLYNKPRAIGSYTNLTSLLNSRLEEFKRLNTRSKKVNVPLEKTPYVQFYPAPAKAKPQKLKVRGWVHPWCEGKREEKNSFPSQLGPQEIDYQDLRFPANLSNPFAVATVLNQEPGKLKIKELKQGNSH